MIITIPMVTAHTSATATVLSEGYHIPNYCKSPLSQTSHQLAREGEGGERRKKERGGGEGGGRVCACRENFGMDWRFTLLCCHK